MYNTLIVSALLVTGSWSDYTRGLPQYVKIVRVLWGARWLGGVGRRMGRDREGVDMRRMGRRE